MKKPRKLFCIHFSIVALFALSILNQGEARADSKTDKPNVIVILTDDQGWGDLSVHGNTFSKRSPSPPDNLPLLPSSKHSPTSPR